MRRAHTRALLHGHILIPRPGPGQPGTTPDRRTRRLLRASLAGPKAAGPPVKVPRFPGFPAGRAGLRWGACPRSSSTPAPRTARFTPKEMSPNDAHVQMGQRPGRQSRHEMDETVGPIISICNPVSTHGPGEDGSFRHRTASPPGGMDDASSAAGVLAAPYLLIADWRRFLCWIDGV